MNQSSVYMPEEVLKYMQERFIEKCRELTPRLWGYIEAANQRKEHSMSIESDLKRIADALEAIASNQGATILSESITSTPGADKLRPVVSPSQPEEKQGKVTRKKASAAVAAAPVEDAPGETTPTKDDLVDELRALVHVKGAAVAKELLAEYGAGKVSDLKEEQYVEVLKAMKKKAQQ